MSRLIPGAMVECFGVSFTGVLFTGGGANDTNSAIPMTAHRITAIVVKTFNMRRFYRFPPTAFGYHTRWGKSPTLSPSMLTRTWFPPETTSARRIGGR